MNGQTDNQTKSSWWSITAYGDELDKLLALQEGTIEYPSFVKAIFGGKEECPQTKRLHFQGALNTAHVRFSAIKKFLPKSHIESCKSDAESLKKYAMKDETSVGDKLAKSNPKYFTMESLMTKLGETFVEQFLEDYSLITESDDCGYSIISDKLLQDNFFLISLCSQPQVARAWKLYYGRCIKRFKELRDEVPGK